MRRGIAFGVLACCTCIAACGVRLDGDSPSPPDARPEPDTQPPPDQEPDAPPPLGAWGPPQLVLGASTALNEDDGSLSSTTLEMVFSVAEPVGGKDLYYMKRQSPTDTWST